MKIIKALVAAAAMGSTMATLVAPANASGQSTAPIYGKPARINFAASGGILDWHADSDRSLYLRDRAGRWYHAMLSSRCPSLRFQSAIAFETGPLGEFDHWGVIRTRTNRCHVQTLVTSPPPDAKGGPRVVR